MEDKHCDRCGKMFSCNASSISHCWCAKVQVNARSRETIAERYTDCLCETCLQQLTAPPKSLSRQELIQGEHYYFNERGLMVFTSVYLLRRGYCCQNGCLHCPYGFKKQ